MKSPRTSSDASSSCSDMKTLRCFDDVGVTGARNREEWMRVIDEQTRSCKEVEECELDDRAPERGIISSQRELACCSLQ